MNRLNTRQVAILVAVAVLAVIGAVFATRADARATALSTTHRDVAAYIMWPGTPYAHMHIMGRPEGNR